MNTQKINWIIRGVSNHVNDKLLRRILKYTIITDKGCWISGPKPVRITGEKWIKTNGKWEKTTEKWGKTSGNNPDHYCLTKDENGKQIIIHRFMFECFNYKPSKFILHRCAVRGCYNYKHLYEGTQSDNTLDWMALRTFKKVSLDWLNSNEGL